jgi:hypothetical protein
MNILNYYWCFLFNIFHFKSDSDAVNDDIALAFNSSFNYEQLCATIICLYLSTGFNKTQLDKVLELSSITSSHIIPKSFNECTNTLFKKFDEKIIIDKHWYCSQSEDFVISIN